jgi:hypothetical protein
MKAKKCVPLRESKEGALAQYELGAFRLLRVLCVNRAPLN